jgi:hypothetical protein
MVDNRISAIFGVDILRPHRVRKNLARGLGRLAVMSLYH